MIPVFERKEDWRILEDVDSTNSWIFREKPLSGTVVVAKHQTAGRGRRGKSWNSGKGSLLFSVALELDFGKTSLPFSLFSLYAGFVLYETLQSEIREGRLWIKWPNDLYIERDGKTGKLAGILVESEIRGNVSRIAVGTGVNLTGEEWIPRDGGVKSGVLFPGNETESLRVLSSGKERSGDLVLSEPALRILENWSSIWNRNVAFPLDEEGFLKRLNQISFLNGKILVRKGETGKVLGIGPGGALLVESSGGRLESLFDSDWEEVLF